jgi:hypothetical protein
MLPDSSNSIALPNACGASSAASPPKMAIDDALVS